MGNRNICFLSLLLLAQTAFAAAPIQERSLRGASAGEARLSLIAAAESFLGTPYRFGGTNRQGIDCSGLIYMSFRNALNYTIPRTSLGIHYWTNRISRAELQPGDLVFFVTVGQRVSHVGIYTGGGRFIHSASEGPSTGVIISRLDESYWNRTFFSAGRALPWDAETARFMAAARRPPVQNSPPPANPANSDVQRLPVREGANPTAAANSAQTWADTGFFTGFAAGITWGGFFIPDAAVPIRGISTMAAIGYKWRGFRASLELRPEWDQSLTLFSLPLAVSMGSDTLQFFAGSALVIGDPGFNHTWEAGISAAFQPVMINQGALSVYAELALRPFLQSAGIIRFSTGIRYLWLL